MNYFELVIFDCDGVLVDSEPLSAAAHKAVYAMHGVDLPDGVMARCFGMKQKDITKQIAGEIGFDLPDESIPHIWLEVQKLMQKGLEPTHGIVEFLGTHFQNRCVASSSAMERIVLSLRITGIGKQFHSTRLFNSAMVKRGKPAPDLFLHAATQCLAEPKGCAVFEDSFYGVQGAIAAGMTAFGYVGASHCGPNHAAKLKEAGAAAVFSSWADAAEYFQSM